MTLEKMQRIMARETGKHWSVYRQGKSDGIVALISNPPWGRMRSPFVDFVVFKNEERIGEANSYHDVREIIQRLKRR